MRANDSNEAVAGTGPRTAAVTESTDPATCSPRSIRPKRFANAKPLNPLIPFSNLLKIPQTEKQREQYKRRRPARLAMPVSSSHQLLLPLRLRILPRAALLVHQTLPSHGAIAVT